MQATTKSGEVTYWALLLCLALVALLCLASAFTENFIYGLYATRVARGLDANTAEPPP